MGENGPKLVGLDLARYANTQSYGGENVSRTMVAAIRDWVIRAFNRQNILMSSTIEQLAGDLITHAYY